MTDQHYSPPTKADIDRPKHIVIYSHDFGVRRDDRGLFTDIAASLPRAEHVMFDYTHVDDVTNTLTVAPLTEQATRLQQKVIEVRATHPDAVIDLVCHAQGCVVAAIAHAPGIRTTIFTAPPRDVDMEDKMRLWDGPQFTTETTSYLKRRDGSTTVVPPTYWASLKDLDAQELYNALADSTELVIVTATEDEVLGEVIFDKLASHIKVIEIATGHSFEDEARTELTTLIAHELIR